jgi:hypothetical protein
MILALLPGTLEAAVGGVKNGTGKTMLSDPKCFPKFTISAVLAETRKLPRQPLRSRVRVQSDQALRGSRSCRS